MANYSLFEEIYKIQNSESKYMKEFPELNDKDEYTYEIDLNNRTIESPRFISVSKDFNAEILYFKTARYFDLMDLTECVIMVKYVNSKGRAGFYQVPCYKFTGDEQNEIVFPWVISGRAADTAGEILFAVSFNIVEKNEDKEDSYSYAFSLNTMAAKSEVLPGIGVNNFANDNVYVDVFNGNLNDFSNIQSNLQLVYKEIEELSGSVQNNKGKIAALELADSISSDERSLLSTKVDKNKKDIQIIQQDIEKLREKTDESIIYWNEVE